MKNNFFSSFKVTEVFDWLNVFLLFGKRQFIISFLRSYNFQNFLIGFVNHFNYKVFPYLGRRRGKSKKVSDDEDDMDDDDMDEGADGDITAANAEKKSEPRFTRRKGIF